MTDDNNKPYRHGHLIRLRGFNNPKMDGKLGRVLSSVDETTGKNKVVFLVDNVRPPAPSSPPRMLWFQPEHLQHACEHCLVASGALQICGKCKTAQYCTMECARADWARHKLKECGNFGQMRGLGKPLPLACLRGEMTDVRRMVEEEGADVDKGTSSGPTPLGAAPPMPVATTFLVPQPARRTVLCSFLCVRVWWLWWWVRHNTHVRTAQYSTARHGHGTAHRQTRCEYSLQSSNDV